MWKEGSFAFVTFVDSFICSAFKNNKWVLQTVDEDYCDIVLNLMYNATFLALLHSKKK